MSLIAQFLAGQCIRYHWDFLTDEPFRRLLPELAARGVPEGEWPDDRDADGSPFYGWYFMDHYYNIRAGCDTSSESDSDTSDPGHRMRARNRRRQREHLRAGWRFRCQPIAA